MPDAAAQLRYAIERGDYARASALWEQWSAELARHIAAGTLDPVEWSRAQELLRWSRNLLIAERAHLQIRLNTLHAVGAYGSPRSASGAPLAQGRF